MRKTVVRLVVAGPLGVAALVGLAAPSQASQASVRQAGSNQRTANCSIPWGQSQFRLQLICRPSSGSWSYWASGNWASWFGSSTARCANGFGVAGYGIAYR